MQIHSYTDQVFASIDRDLTLERFAGGNESEVYRTDNRRQVVKLKSELGAGVSTALAYARTLRAMGDDFAACLGPRYSIHSDYLLARDDAGQVQVLIIQPYIKHARPLHHVNFSRLTAAERAHIADQLSDIIRRARKFYRETGTMPDLYGRHSSSSDERQRMRRSRMLPLRVWSFLVQRHLLRSHNLLLTDPPECRIILIDYDPVRRSILYRRIYYLVRWLLFFRDQLVIAKMRRGR